MDLSLKDDVSHSNVAICKLSNGVEELQSICKTFAVDGPQQLLTTCSLVFEEDFKAFAWVSNGFYHYFSIFWP